MHRVTREFRSAVSENRRPAAKRMADVLVALALKQIGAEIPTAPALLRLAVTLAQEANRLPGLKGRDRLDLVLKVLRETLATPVIRERLTPEAQKVLADVLETVVPETISLAVEASRGGFQLKKPSVGCAVRLGALLCRTVAAYAPASGPVAAVAGQMASTAETVAVAVEEKAAAEEPVAAKGPAETAPATPVPAAPAAPEGSNPE
jgi:hypothetical protein